MLLSCRFLTNVASANSFDYAQQGEFYEGDAPTLYLQLLDVTKDRASDTPGRRFCPASGATLQVVIENINDAKKVTRVITQPFAGDSSIWALPIQTSDGLKGTVNLRLRLTEGAVVTNALVRAALRVANSSNI